MSREDKYSMSTMFGGNPATTNLTYTANTTADAFATIPSANTTAGTVFTTLTVSNATDNGRVFVDETDTLNFCIPVMSAFGLLADTLIPVGWLSSDLRFDFYTETPAVAFRNTTGGGTNGSSYTLTNLELVVDYIEFEGVSLEAVYQYAPPSGPVYCHGSTYKCYTDSITTGTDGFYTHILPHRSLSVKQVLSATHLSTIANGGDAFGRVFPYGADGSLSAGLSIGGQKWPQKPITTVAEAFTELQKSQHSFNSLLMNGSISSTEYAKWLNTTTNSSADKAVLGFDTEIYDKKGSTIVNGQNWTGLNVFLEGEVGLSTGAALSAPLNRNTFVLFDVIYVYSDGVLSVRF
jgi:hypothetical protein